MKAIDPYAFDKRVQKKRQDVEWAYCKFIVLTPEPIKKQLNAMRELISSMYSMLENMQKSSRYRKYRKSYFTICDTFLNVISDYGILI